MILFEQRLFSGVPNLWLVRFASHPLSEFMDMGYFLYYPLFPVVAGVLYARRDEKVFRELVLASVLMYLIAFTVYLVFPCEGPRKAFAGFQDPPSGWLFSYLVRTIQGGAGVHGNALPSSHVAFAVLCGLAARKNAKKLFPFVAASACLICLSAVYDGYHYASDVLAGIYASDVLAGILVALISAGLVHARARLKISSLDDGL